MCRTVSYDYILFDLDGTISESGPGITRSAQHALHEMGIDEPDLKKLEVFVGPPLNVTFQERYGFSPAQSAEAVRLFQERYDRIGVFENALYPGVEDMLKTLKAAGKHLAIASSKPRHLIPMVLGKFGIEDYFEVIAAPGYEQELTGKMDSDNKSRMVHLALELLGLVPAERQHGAEIQTIRVEKILAEPASCRTAGLQTSSCLTPTELHACCAMVGDRFYDIRGALDNHVTAVGAVYGYGTRAELEQAGAEILVDSAEELTRVLMGI